MKKMKNFKKVIKVIKWWRLSSDQSYQESCQVINWINLQSLEDTQVGYILQKYTLDNYTLEKYTLAQKSLVMVATSLVMVATSLVMMSTSLVMVSTSLVMVLTSLVMVLTSLVMVIKDDCCTEGRPEIGNLKVWLTYGRTDQLKWVGARDTCVSNVIQA